jgi:hypothetical protein
MEKEKHTCGSFPDPMWTDDDFIRKHEAMKKCNVCQKIIGRMI